MIKLVAAIVFLFALIPSVSAHRYFFGLTEISANKNTQAIEIIHQYTLHDVQQVLKKRLGKALDWKKKVLKNISETG